MNARQVAAVAAAGLLGLLQACAPGSNPATPPEDARAAAFAKLPDWRGFWIAEGMESDISGYTVDGPTAALDMKFAGEGAPWKPEHAAKIRAMTPALMAATAKGKSSSWGYPMMMQSFAPLQFLITPEETLMMNFYRDVRHVYTDGRKQPAPDDLWPTPWGSSVGHWEGDTLVIETIAVQRPGLLYVPFPLVSEAARYTERLRRVSPDRIESRFTIEDEATLTGPWTFTLAYIRKPGVNRLIHEVFDNDRVAEDASGELLTITPPKP